jgi:two-component system response regulator BaeR
MMIKNARILIVEDQPEMQHFLQTLLTRKGFQVCVAGDGETGLKQLMEFEPHLVMLDVEMPQMDGLSFCRLARQSHDVPILMVSGRADTADRVLGLELGADDYLPKPFDQGELMARIKALLRRRGWKPGSAPVQVAWSMDSDEPKESTETFHHGPLRLDLRSYEASLEGDPLSLTPLEFKLLEVFMRDAGRAFSRERLLQLVWRDEFAPSERLVDTHIKHLRRKLSAARPGYSPLVSVRGVGYRFDP